MAAEDPRVKDLFVRVAELPEPDRAAFLDAACGGDGALRAAVEDLLDAAGRAGQFLAAPTGVSESQLLDRA
jgi:hypothetical protein